MSPIQQMLLGVGAVATKTYVDDIFSTFLYNGTGSAQTINNGIDVSGEGALVWIKSRNGTSRNHYVYDTVRGAGKHLEANNSWAEATDNSNLSGFTSTGFTLGSGADANENTKDIASWSFRRASGFFTICEWSGNATAGREISHDLGSVPGMIIVKETTGTQQWYVYHRETGPSKYLVLNSTGGAVSGTDFTNGVTPTSTAFTLSSDAAVNGSSKDYIAYVFAGGASDEPGSARSVDFDGSGDYLSLGSSSDFAFGTGSFTVEFWVKIHSTSNCQLLDFRTDGGSSSQSGKFNLYLKVNDELLLRGPSSTPDIGVPHSKFPVNIGQWTHIAVVRNSSTTTVYVNGIAGNSASDTNDYTDATLLIGKSSQSSSINLDGEISNFRIVKGTAVYTSSFRPPTEGLTNITNTKLLCCNKNTVTGSTVTPGTITSNGNPQSSTDTPFDDPAGFVFGENEDQGVIKSGSYIGSGSAGLEVNLGWEPQWVMIKRTTGSYQFAHWYMFDSMRGIVSGGNDSFVKADVNASELSHVDLIDLTSTGFKITTTSDGFNSSGDTFVYTAIRRPDGYVGKPCELGSGCFQMDTGNTQTTIPNYDSGFPVDFALLKNPGTATSWDVTARLTGTKYLKTDTNGAEANFNDYTFDSNTGWAKDNGPGTMQSWMWKRHAGFDVVIYTGDDVAGRPIPHSLNKTPEMVWLKKREAASSWVVYHKGVNGGSSPEDYYLKVNDTNAQSALTDIWNDTAPSANHLTIGTWSNSSGDDYIAMLFASVDGISKCGSYTGSDSAQTITLGFQPRFVIVKNVTNSNDWIVIDSVRGMASSDGNNSKKLQLNTTAAQDNTDIFYSSGQNFTVNGNNPRVNDNGSSYIYYAHS